MLRFLRVKNFALIEHLEIDFTPGLNLLTGETGSGKSILIDALGLVLGERASNEMIRTGTDSCEVEALFIVPNTHDFTQLVNNYGITIGDNELIIKREIATQGRSRAFVNNTLVTLQTLRSLGAALVDLQGQGEQQILRSVESHRRFLDLYAGCGAEVEAVRHLHQQMASLQGQREGLRTSEQERLRRLDLLGFQAQEIDRTAPRAGEELELEETRNLLANAGKLSELAHQGYDLIYENEAGLLALLSRAHDCLDQLRGIDPRARPHFDQISNMRYTLEDAAFFLRDYLQAADFDPERLDAVEARLAALDRLQKKYGGSISEVLVYRERIGRELEELEFHEEHEAKLKAEFGRLRKQYLSKAGELAEARRAAARSLEKALARELRQLAMEKVRFQVQVDTQSPAPDDDTMDSLSSEGTDRVEFLVAVNPGEELRPLSKTASGGELSRIYLALRGILTAEWSAGTLIFDEVDAGIGGRVAELVGRKLKQVSSRNQVLCVTHLPQIAALADQHSHIFKQTRDGRTRTCIEVLSGERRVEEIARMLGGARLTETATRHAKEMLHNQS